MSGYWMVRSSEVRDTQAMSAYGEAWSPIASKYGAKIVAGRGVRHETKEGEAHARALIIEFPSYEDALACYDDPDYQKALQLVDKAYAFRDLVIVESS